MVEFIPRPKSFGDQIAEGIGQGASAGLQQMQQMMMQMSLEKQKQAERQKNISMIEGGSQGQQGQGDISQKFLEMLPEIENRIGRELAPEDLDKLWSAMNQSQNFSNQMQNDDPFAKAKKYAAVGEHDLSRIAMEEGKANRKEEFSKSQALEPKLLELQDSLASSEETGLRFDRLGQLIAPENDSKFPPSLMTGLFTKNGELNSVAASQLSPEAQEFTKLVIDEIQGAQKTYGGKVSNFEAAQYLKKLPGLLNSAEGRRRVLRDLKIMNKLTQMHDQGVLDVMEKYNNKISLSKANSIYKKENAKKESNIKKAFVYPNEFPFDELDEFNASIYPGITIQDPETGQTFTSNGRNWEME